MHNSNNRPRIVSYDSGYEHSLEHRLETHRLFAEADEVTQPTVKSSQDQDKKKRLVRTAF